MCTRMCIAQQKKFFWLLTSFVRARRNNLMHWISVLFCSFIPCRCSVPAHNVYFRLWIHVRIHNCDFLRERQHQQQHRRSKNKCAFASVALLYSTWNFTRCTYSFRAFLCIIFTTFFPALCTHTNVVCLCALASSFCLSQWNPIAEFALNMLTRNEDARNALYIVCMVHLIQFIVHVLVHCTVFTLCNRAQFAIHHRLVVGALLRFHLPSIIHILFILFRFCREFVRISHLFGSANCCTFIPIPIFIAFINISVVFAFAFCGLSFRFYSSFFTHKIASTSFDFTFYSTELSFA